MTLSILIATETMWPRVRALRLRALEHDPDAFGSTYATESAQAQAFWRDRLTGAATTLVAVRDGVDVGLVVVAPYWDNPARDAGLFSVWVAPEARRSGAGRALVAAALELARQRGFERLVLEVGDHNTAAIALYASMGFVPTGRTSALDPPRAHVTEHERAAPLRGQP